jgi:hypothetical protein
MQKYLTKADERALAAYGSKTGFWRLLQLTVILLPLLCIAGALGEFSVAYRLATHEGYTLWDIAALWYSPDPAGAYSGIQLLAVKRIEAAFGRVLLAIVFGGVTINVLIESRRRSRIYSLLHSRGLIVPESPRHNIGN